MNMYMYIHTYRVLVHMTTYVFATLAVLVVTLEGFRGTQPYSWNISSYSLIFNLVQEVITLERSREHSFIPGISPALPFFQSRPRGNYS